MAIWLRPRRRLPAIPFLCGLILFGLLACTSTPTLLAQNDDGNSQDAAIDFRDDVAPILARRCLTCHDAREQKGDFRLDTKSHLLDSGYVEPLDPDASFLLTVITPDDGPPRMPKDSDPLTEEQVRAIERWIEAGAEWPDGFQLEPPKVTDRNWWSLKPLQASEPPEIDDQGRGWVRTEIDRFIYAKLREQQLTPSAEADRRTLIRRLTFDLTGLPPTPQEIESFLADRAPDAYERLVDRLLASPAYGERWARHWLDVVHYADTHGYDKDKLRPNAWPYRDYVIRAFNRDKPYARFVREQLAGDALYPDTVDGVVATGFIAAGPWDFIGHAEVPESKRDGQVARNLDRDNMVTSTMNTFCSLTVQCARCHHHKLDPVTMEDYYRLQAVFASIDRADRDYDVSPDVASRRAELLAERDRLQRIQKQHQQAVEAAKTPAIKQLEERLAAAREARPVQAAAGVKRSPAFGYHSQVAASQNTTKWVQVDLGRSLPIDDVFVFGANEYGFADFGFPHRFRVESSDDPSFETSSVLGDYQREDVARPGGYAFHIPADGSRGRYVRVTATKLWNRRRAGQPLTSHWIFALGELTVLSGNQPVPIVDVDSLDSIEAKPRWSQAALVDGVYGTHGLDALVGSAKLSLSNGYHSQFAADGDAVKTVTVQLPRAATLDSIRLIPAFPTDWKDTPGFGFPVRFKVEIAKDASFDDAILVLDKTDADVSNPGQRAYSISLTHLPLAERNAGAIRLTATRLWDRGERKYLLAIGELQAFSQGRNVAAAAEVTATDSIEGGRWGRDRLVDGFSSRRPSEQLRSLLLSRKPPTEVDDASALASRIEQLMKEALGKTTWDAQRATEAQLNKIAEQLKALPKPRKVYAGVVHQGSGAFRGRAGLGPRTINVLHRGNVGQPVKEVGPGAPPLTPGVASTFAFDEDDPESLRRIALAEWITHRDNPLTWRSIVNRVWVHHLGRGIADTPNDFGRGGKRPTHPRLLDWLAADFRDSGGSIKRLQRLIVTSAVYRQRSVDRTEAAAVDAGNRFYWRQSRRRLSAEELRDTMLRVADQLNRGQGGPGFQDFVIEQPQHSPHYEYEKHDPNDPSTHRRTIYRFIVRSQPQPFMDTLDCADPSISVPKRDETLTSLQALAMLNNQFVIAMADRFAARLADKHDAPSEQVRQALRRTLGRDARPGELQLLTDYAQAHGLANACRLIFNLNEFVFVD